MALSPDYQTSERMALKLRAIPLPDLRDKRVLDIGTDMGYWARLAADMGAVSVLGLDRNRAVRGEMVDLIAENRKWNTPGTRFELVNLGKQWHEFGRFDVAFVFSVYHHIYNNCGDHAAVWFWLWRHVAPGGILLWEGPMDDGDPVVRANVAGAHRAGYTREAIIAAASRYFEAEHIGPALHEPTREVWRFRPKLASLRMIEGEMRSGQRGAEKAFLHDDGRRCREIHDILGVLPVPGSLNLAMSAPFDWDSGYFRAEVLDVVRRSEGFDGEWRPRWARFYPVEIDGIPAHAFRFEGELYGPCFVELIAPERLRDRIAGPKVMVTR
jgi:2-polyprenyl-3-methyl-5-hydroxy-6-metoxy-1,4-benzoquinol methylase